MASPGTLLTGHPSLTQPDVPPDLQRTEGSGGLAKPWEAQAGGVASAGPRHGRTAASPGDGLCLPLSPILFLLNQEAEVDLHFQLTTKINKENTLCMYRKSVS